MPPFPHETLLAWSQLAHDTLGLFLALTWLIQSARARKGKAMAQKLADELAEAFQGQGTTIKKREDTHKMAEANRAFAHYRW